MVKYKKNVLTDNKVDESVRPKSSIKDKPVGVEVTVGLEAVVGVEITVGVDNILFAGADNL